MQQDHLGHLLMGWAQRHCQGRLPGAGATQQATLSQRPGSKISFLEDLEGALPNDVLREGASIIRTSTHRGPPARLETAPSRFFIWLSFKGRKCQKSPSCSLSLLNVNGKICSFTSLESKISVPLRKHELRRVEAGWMGGEAGTLSPGPVKDLSGHATPGR